MRDEYLPFARPSIGEDEIREVADSLRSGWVTTGPKTEKFEKAFGEYVGASHAVAVSSCTAGLHLSLAAMGIGEGDEVIVPTMTFCATANVVVHLGAKPVLVDVGNDFNLTPEAVEGAVTDATRAVMPVHYGGQSCDLKPIYDVARRHDLAVIEDAAHAVDAAYRGDLIGSDALGPGGEVLHCTAFSFYATKNLTTGEGGMVTTANAELAERIRVLRLHGMSRDAWKRYTEVGSWYYEVVAPGYKANMTDVQAAIGLHQLDRLPEFTETRQAYARRYDKAFRDFEPVRVPVRHPDRKHVAHLYPLQVDFDEVGISRDEFITGLEKHRIGASVHFIPVHRHPYYRDELGWSHREFPTAEKLYERLVSLPLYPAMELDDVDSVVGAVKEVLGGGSA